MAFRPHTWFLCAVLATQSLFIGVTHAGTVQDMSYTGTSNYNRIQMEYYARQEANKYNTVGIIRSDFGNQAINTATGTLIGKRWVLTAAHVVEGQSDLSFQLNGQIYDASRWFVHKSYQGDGLIALGGDVALIKLDRAVKGVAPSTVAPKYTHNKLKDEVVTTVGYGGSGTGITGYGLSVTNAPTLTDYNWSISSAIRRAGHNMIDGYYYDTSGFVNTRMFTTDFDPEPMWRQNGTITSNWIEDPDEFLNGSGYRDIPVTGEWSVTAGDSGGPTFNDKGQIIGITSFVNNPAWYQENMVWYAAMGFYHALNLDGERSGARTAPDGSAPGYSIYFSEDVYTNAALYKNWMKKVMKLANQAGTGAQLQKIAALGSDARGPLIFAGTGLSAAGASQHALALNADLTAYLASIPEPGTALLLIAGSSLCLRRRRRA